LFAALNMIDGTVIGDCMPRHRHQEFIRFLQIINTKVPMDLDPLVEYFRLMRVTIADVH
jgi:hypothetical protein